MKKTRLISLLVLIISLAAVLSFNSLAASKVTVSLSKTSYTYSGNANTPGVTVKNNSGSKLKKGTDYTVSYSSGRKNVGKYTVTVTLKGKYSGTVKKSFNVNPKGTNINSVTPSAAGVKVDIKKQATQTSGYQLQYATNSKFTSAKTKNATSTAISVSSLKMNTKYYLRVRTYKTVSGSNYYSGWSTASTATTTLPSYKSSAYVKINGNKPTFTSSEITKKSFEKYSKLDSLGRCGIAVASVGKDIMPTEARGSIGQVKPTGWHTVKYDCVSGKYLYNRCHLIAFELAGENANEKNLITGTRYMNIEGMLPFENMVHDFVKETGYHVMYRVTPVFKGNDLLVRGVQIEGYSVEDKGDGISFNVYCFNVQPGVKITYSNGDSCLAGSSASSSKPAKVTGLKASSKTANSVTLSWSTASGATKYYVYRYNSSTKKYTLVGNTTSKSYKVTGLGSGTSYTFAVRSYKSSNGKDVWGDYSAHLTVKTNASSGSSSSSANTVKQTVYVTKTGSKYHVSGCRYLSASSYSISLTEAKSAGYQPCSTCCK